MSIKYKNITLIVGNNEVKVLNKEDGSLIYINKHVTNETMQEHISVMTELLSSMKVKFTLNDDYYYKNNGVRLMPTIRLSI